MLTPGQIFARVGDGLIRLNSTDTHGDLRRVLTNAPIGAAAGAIIGGGAGALLGLRNRSEEETKKQAALRGAKRGCLMGAAFGFVSGLAIRPPLSDSTSRLRVLDKQVKDVMKTGLPGNRRYQILDSAIGIIERHNNVMEPVALASGATGMKLYANLNIKKGKATDDPKEKRKYELIAFANHVIAIYLATRIWGKCWGRIRANYPDLAMSKVADGGAWLINTATSSPVHWKDLFKAAFSTAR